MSIFLNKNTKIICQGLTGKKGTSHSKELLRYGTNIVCGVTPGKGGKKHLGLPIFNTVLEAVKVTHAEVSIIYVPAQSCKDAILEAINAEIKFVICITEGVPILDMLIIKKILKKNKKTILLGPNCFGIISPGKYAIGIMPTEIYYPGSVGIVSRSGTLSYEITKQITDIGLGQSICIGIGGDRIVGLSFVEILKFLRHHQKTKIIIIIGEIGGSLEEECAFYIKQTNMTKPVIFYIAGITAPIGKQMGHLGAIIYQEKKNIFGSAHKKIEVLRSLNIEVVQNISSVLTYVKKYFRRH